MNDFSDLLEKLPVGADVYDFLSKTVDDLVYPDLGRPFYIQAFVAVGLCGLVILAISTGFFIRWRKGRLSFLLADGPATRPAPKTVVPLLWLITGILLIVHTLWLHKAMTSHHLTYGLGVFWWMMAGALVCSYAVISTSVICSAPAIRKGLMHLNSGESERRLSPAFLAVNGGLLCICILAVASTCPPGIIAGDGFVLINETYVGVQALIAKAREEKNLAVMASFGTYVEAFERSRELNHRSIYIGGVIYSMYIIVFFLTGLIPAIFLNIYLRKRIERLDKGLGTATLYQTDSILKQPSGPVLAWFESESQERDVEILAEERPARPTLLEPPKDRPFANLTSTSMLPMNYASIFQAHVDPKEKARRLKLALRRDNLQLMAYFLMLGSLGSLAFFQAAKGPNSFNTKDQFISAQSWEMFSYLVPAMILAAAFLYDAVNNTGGEDVVLNMQVSTFANRNFHAPPLASIQLSQTVEVVEERDLGEKGSIYQVHSKGSR